MKPEWMTRGVTVYWTRIVPNCEIFEVYPLVVHNTTDTYFTGIDSITKRTYLFGYTNIGRTVFQSQLDATTALTDAETAYLDSKGKKKLSKSSEVDRDIYE